MADKEKMTAFLQEYEALCRKHKMYINSCGCCDIPWIAEDGAVEEAMQHLREYEEIENEG